MNILKISKLRRKFKQNLDLSTSLYENKIRSQFGENNQKSKELIFRMNVNKENYLLLNHIDWIFYKKAIELYNTTIIKDLNTDDVRKTIVLFFPYFLKSIKSENLIQKANINEFRNKAVGKQIHQFIVNYNQLEQRDLILHRREMFLFLEFFLHLLTLDEVGQIALNEKKEYMVFHYFRPFLRPELYFNEDKEGLL
jgi:hypothetical protein